MGGTAQQHTQQHDMIKTRQRGNETNKQTTINQSIKNEKKVSTFSAAGRCKVLEAQGVAAPTVPLLSFSASIPSSLPELQSRTFFDLASSSTNPHRQEPFPAPLSSSPPQARPRAVGPPSLARSPPPPPRSDGVSRGVFCGDSRGVFCRVGGWDIWPDG
jgi:hypothetical protein